MRVIFGCAFFSGIYGIIYNMKLNSTNVFCDLIFSGSITLTSYTQGAEGVLQTYS